MFFFLFIIKVSFLFHLLIFVQKKSYQKINKSNPKFLSSIGVSDGRYFADDKVSIINVGPGTGDEGHKSNEKLLNSDLINYYLILDNFLNKIN